MCVCVCVLVLITTTPHFSRTFMSAVRGAVRPSMVSIYRTIPVIILNVPILEVYGAFLKGRHTVNPPMVHGIRIRHGC